MLRLVPSLLLLLTACGDEPATVPFTGPCTADDCLIQLWAQDPFQTSEPVLSVEFSESLDQVGELGWHVQASIDTQIELNSSIEELQRLLEDRGHNLILANTTCVRWNVDYGNGRHLCEEQGDDDHVVVADTYLLWGSSQWEAYIWPAPEGGCSVIACNP